MASGPVKLEGSRQVDEGRRFREMVQQVCDELSGGRDGLWRRRFVPGLSESVGHI